MSKRGAVVIELDSAPQALDVPTSGDYLEQCVASALFSPALRLVSASPGSDYFEFVVDEGQRFSDGLPVHPRHVLGTLVKAAKAPQWARYIAYLEKAEIIGDRLCLRMRHPACFYPDMLRTVDFAPTHPDAAVGNGPYQMGDECDTERGYYHLIPNPHARGWAHRPGLVFRLETDVARAPDRFRRGDTDITCSTAFPLDRLDEWRDSPALHQAPTGIFMQLEPNPSGDGPLADPSLRRAMLGSLDLEVIAANFRDGLRPAGYRVRSTEAGSRFPSELRIGYHDFYPNREVLEQLSAQWQAQLGIHCELVERDYAVWQPADHTDGSFALRYLPFNHPYAHFDQCAALMTDPAFSKLMMRFAAGEDTRDAMNTIVQETLPMIRLFEVIGNWLTNPRVTGFNWPTDAAFDFSALRCDDRHIR